MRAAKIKRGRTGGCEGGRKGWREGGMLGREAGKQGCTKKGRMDVVR